MYLYEAHPILGDGVEANVDEVRICCAEEDVYLSETLKTSFSRLLSTHALEAIVISDCDVKALG